jgi:hypothetical protein
MIEATRTKAIHKAVLLLFGGLAALGAAGCGGGSREVSGTVSYRGRPLASGTVLLLAGDGRPYNGAIGPDGSFTIKDVPTGEARVAVTSFAPADPERPSWAGAVLPAANGRMATLTGIVSTIPPRYGDLGQSGLAVTVEEDTRLDLDLE